MKWKLFFSLVIIAVLIIFLQTQKFGIEVPQIAGQTIGKFYEILKNFFRKMPAKKFPALIEVNEESFYGQEIELANASFTGKGICKDRVRLNKILITTKEKECKVKAEIRKGKMFFWNGIIELEAELKNLDLDETSYRGELLNVELKIDPKTIFIGILGKELIILNEATGEIKKLKEDGSLDQLKILKKEEVRIENFAGNIIFKEGKVRLGGTVSLIKGENFEFKV